MRSPRKVVAVFIVYRLAAQRFNDLQRETLDSALLAVARKGGRWHEAVIVAVVAFTGRQRFTAGAREHLHHSFRSASRRGVIKPSPERLWRIA